jgi:hypothetical protein
VGLFRLFLLKKMLSSSMDNSRTIPVRPSILVFSIKIVLLERAGGGLTVLYGRRC